ncbi:FAD:protein FMN transferase [Longimicrobium sp.]|uniref:FAD:protein FMN transferase n=1 Tax=Longimicrobium sp. TaxID=2029185 RepID=UPI002BCF5CC9|nr:FAD:protein FMN transferase [Longimicrobium sp.]HSU15425.1 FAD:protein FMN transferase [Longimicrobium sp.]
MLSQLPNRSADGDADRPARRAASAPRPARMLIFFSCMAMLAVAGCRQPRMAPVPAAIEYPRYVSSDTIPPPIVRAWPAMGAMLEISVWDADSARARAAMEAARAAVLRVDSLMSPESAPGEVAAANRRAGTDSATTLSPWTAEVLDSALAIAAASGGAVDVTAAPLAGAWRAGAVPPQQVRDSLAARVGWRMVRFDRVARRVSLPQRGMRLDFGEMARGFAVDRGVAALRAAGIGSAVLDVGGTFRVLGPTPVTPGWTMGLTDPRGPGEVFAAVHIDSGAVATMGDYGQMFEAGGERWSRVLDPRRGVPARGVVSVSVLAPSGMLADALLGAFFVMGPEEGCRWAARYPGVDVVWVRDAGHDEEKEDDDEAMDPDLVVITDALKDRLEILTEEPTDERPTTCSQLLAHAKSSVP